MEVEGDHLTILNLEHLNSFVEAYIEAAGRVTRASGDAETTGSAAGGDDTACADDALDHKAGPEAEAPDRPFEGLVRPAAQARATRPTTPVR